MHRTIIAVDIEGFGAPSRTMPHQLGTRAGLYKVVEEAFGAAGVPWDRCRTEDRGDAVFILVPPDIPKSPLVETVPEALAHAVQAHNHTSHQQQRVRLRMAIHAGEVAFDDHGVTSTAVTTTFRLLDAPPVKQALADSPGVVALIVSRWVFDEVVRHSTVLDPATFRPIPVAVKETHDTAWVALPDQPYPANPTMLDHRDDRTRQRATVTDAIVQAGSIHHVSVVESAVGATRTAKVLALAVTLAVIGTLLLLAISNVAAHTLPDTWQPYLWLAWPLGTLLAAPMIYLEVRKRRHLQEYHPGTVADGERLGRAAHDLAEAVRLQWTREAGRRSLHSPEPIRVRWSSTGRPVAAELSKVLTGDVVVGGRPLRLRGDIRQVAEVFRQVRARQLVILGAPTAGKSVLALLLTLGLLPEEPVPVLLAISSWNPYQDDLHSWVARRIVEEYPALANPGRYGPDAARRLLDDRRVVPVLDGLDEMSDALQPVALDAIGRAVVDHYPLVVTCRSTEYHKAIDRNGRFLAHAAVLEIQPVAIDDAAAFLEGADPHPERWQPILDHLKAHPNGALARALRSPLMLDLTRTIHTTPGATPDELCDSKRFPDQGSIERYLFDAFLHVVYDSHSAAPGSQPGSALARYSAERAGDWLRFLAAHLNRLDDHNLAWWQLEDAISRPIRGVVPGLAVGLTFGTMHGLLLGAPSGLAFAAILFITVGFAGSFGRTRRPSRIRIRFRGNGGPLLRRIVMGIALGICYIPVFGMRDAVPATFVYIAALTTHMWLNDPPDEASAASPTSMLRQDRGATLALGGVLTLIFGPMFSLMSSGHLSPHSVALWNGIAIVTIDAAIGAMLGGLLYGRVGAIAAAIAGAGLGWVSYTIDYPELAQVPHLAAHMASGLMISVAAVLSRAWGAFALTGLCLALRGQLPLRLMRFLDDAHQRGILRQSGTMYQFRHRALQDWLANSDPTFEAHPPSLKTPAR